MMKFSIKASGTVSGQVRVGIALRTGRFALRKPHSQALEAPVAKSSALQVYEAPSRVLRALEVKPLLAAL